MLGPSAEPDVPAADVLPGDCAATQAATTRRLHRVMHCVQSLSFNIVAKGRT